MPIFPWRRTSLLENHLKELSQHYPLWIEENRRFVIVTGFMLPPGYNAATTQILIELPKDYPVSPPGVGGHRLYVSPSLRFRQQVLRDVHPHVSPCYPTPGFGPWAWLCYQYIRWDPRCDNIIRLMELVRGNLTNPRTH